MAALKKILLVDDDDDLREALAEQLVATDEFDVFEAANGAGAFSVDAWRRDRKLSPVLSTGGAL